MVRIFGIGLLCVCILALGGMKCKEYRESVYRCEQMIRLMRYIQRQICDYLMPLDEICASWNTPIDFGNFDLEIKEKGITLAYEHSGKCLALSPQFDSLVREFCLGVGKTDEEGQRALCDTVIGQAEQLLNGMKEELPNKIKVARTLSLCAAAMVAILLI